MKLARYFPVLAVAAFLAGCGGKGSPAPAPQLLSVTGEDGQITLNWKVETGVQYRVYCAPGTSVTNGSWYTTFGGVARAEDTVSPPFTVDSVQNNTVYACTVDGRYNGGPAGPSATSLSTTTRSAGADWHAAAITGVSNLSAVAAGTLSAFTSDKFFAVGSSGQLRVTDAVTNDVTAALSGTWTTVAVPSGLGDLSTAVVFGGKLLVVGSTGLLAYTSDLQNWGTVALGGAVHKLVSSGTRLVAVGSAGLIRYSTDGVTWATPTLPAALPALRDAAYSEAGYWVAIGDSGTVLKSADGNAASWTAMTGPGSAADLHAVAALKVQTPNTLNYEYRLVAVGDSGTVGYSIDGQAWTWKTEFAGARLTQVAAGNQTLVQLDAPNSKIYAYAGGQVMVAGDGGKLFRSGDALSWTSWSSPGWQDVSAFLASTSNSAALFRYAKSRQYSTSLVYAYTWLQFGSDGAGRYAR